MEQIGRYEVRGELGRGGFGSVYRAWDPVMRRHVAIKVLTAVSEVEMLARFRSEAGTTGSLKHKNIITVFDYGEHALQPYLVMELLEGRSLKDVIEKGPTLPLLEVSSILLQVAQGLQYAHENGVVHRDIKPANIMLLTDGSVKILDFGIARFMDQSRTRHTATGMIIGTMEYMSPDQIQGGEADALGDIFAYGVTVYELLTGKQPFRANQLSTVLYLITNVDPAPIRDLIPSCPEALETIVRTAMAKDRGRRYQSIQDLIFDLAPIELALRTSGADELLDAARSLFNAGDLEAAQSYLRRALILDPSHIAGQELRNEIKYQRELESLRRRVRDVLRTGEDLMARKSLDQAIEVFEAALRLTGSGFDVTLRQEVENHLTAAKEQRESTRLFFALLSEAREGMQRGDFATARERSSRAAAVDSSSQELTRFFEQLSAAEREDKERREREDLVCKVTQRVREHVRSTRFDEAGKLLTGALARYLADPELESLRAEVSAAEKAHQTRVRAQEERQAEEQRRSKEEQRAAEQTRIAEEQLRNDEQQRTRDERRRAEELRKTEEAHRVAEQCRIAEEMRSAAEQRRVQDGLGAAEQARIKDEKRTTQQYGAPEESLVEEQQIASKRALNPVGSSAKWWVLIGTALAIAAGTIISVPAILSRGKSNSSASPTRSAPPNQVLSAPRPQLTQRNELPALPGAEAPPPKTTLDSDTRPKQQAQPKPTPVMNVSKSETKPSPSTPQSIASQDLSPPIPVSHEDAAVAPSSNRLIAELLEKKEAAPSIPIGGTVTAIVKSNKPTEADIRQQVPVPPPQVSKLALAMEANKRGVELYSLNLTQEAIINFTEAIRLAPNLANVHYNRAGAHYRLGHFEQAISDYERALALEPDNPHARDMIKDAHQKLDSKTYVPGDGVSSPTLVHLVPPKYTREAHDAGLHGSVLVQLVVDEKGHTRAFRIVKSLGLGLDEKAIEATKKWKFCRP